MKKLAFRSLIGGSSLCLILFVVCGVLVAERCFLLDGVSMPDPFITFITPTRGRVTLQRTLDSMIRQTDGDWEAMVIRDGWEDNQLLLHYDARIWSFRADERSAGECRNIGLYAVPSTFQQSPWVGFVDDDDALDPHYVQLLRETAEDCPHADIVVFRMRYPDGRVLPDPERPRLSWGGVGISFAVKRHWFNQVRFVRENLHKPGRYGNEDICLLTDLHEKGAKTFLHPTVAYYVNHDPYGG